MHAPQHATGYEARPAEAEGFAAKIAAEASAWAAGRSWLLRAPLLVWLAYIGVRQFASAEYTSLFGALNLGIHEGGHILFAPLGLALGIAGGTLLQLTCPVAALWMFLRQPDWFAAAVSLAWLSTNLHNVGTYVADAQAMELPLVTVGGGDALHDWNFLLGRLGLLEACEALGALVHGLAHVTMIAALASGAWLLVLMARQRASVTARS